jgi:hypothetical protein
MTASKLRGAVDDESVQRCAVGMIRAHKDLADHECKAVIARMVKRRDKEGETVWRRILKEINVRAPTA